MAPLSYGMAAARSRAFTLNQYRKLLARSLNVLPSQLCYEAPASSCHREAQFSSRAHPPASTMMPRRRLKTSNWVPDAYRGAKKDRNGARGNAAPPPMSWKRGGRGPATKHGRHEKEISEKKRNESRLSDAEWKSVRAKERRLMLLLEEFLGQAETYQTSFLASSDGVEEKDQQEETNQQGEKHQKKVKDQQEVTPQKHRLAINEKRRLLSTENLLADRIRTTLQGPRDADVPVDERKLVATEVDFVALCNTMQRMCSLSCSLSQLSNNDKEFAIFMGIAEQILLELIRLLQERCLLIESAHTWGDQAKRSTVPEGKDDHRSTGVSKWLNTVVKSILSPISKGDQQRDQGQMPRELIGGATMSKAGKVLDETTERLLSAVVTCIITQATNQLDDSTLDVSESKVPDHHGQILEKAADRVLNVLENAPTSWDATNDAVNKAIQLLAGAASYNSAQKCRLVFERHCSPHHADTRLSSVLQAYLQAIKHTKDPPDVMSEIVLEAYDFLDANFDHRAPSTGPERLQAISVMLQIMAADTTRELSTQRLRCEMADSLLEKVDGCSASELCRQVNSESTTGSISVQHTPLLDSLACLYASSEDPERVELAHKMLDHMLKNVGQGPFFRFPSTETCNEVLRAIVRKHEAKLIDTGDVSNEGCDDKNDRKHELKPLVNGDVSNKGCDGEDDLNYSEKLISFLYQRQDAECMPNKYTLELAFRLLTAIEPHDEVVRAQKILSMAEAYYLLQGTGKTRTMGTQAYDDTLQMWLRIASSESRKHLDMCAAQQALWLVERMEIRSTPAFLSDSLLKDSPFPFLYDTEARPTKSTYHLALRTCAATIDEKHFDKAAEAALTLATKMERLDLLQHMHIKRLTDCADKLCPTSDVVKKIDSFIEKRARKQKKKKKFYH